MNEYMNGKDNEHQLERDAKTCSPRDGSELG